MNTIIGMPCKPVGDTENEPFLLIRRAPRERRVRVIVGGDASCVAPTVRLRELVLSRSNLLEQIIAALVVIPLVMATLRALP